MWVDMDDLRADLERSRREIEEEFDEESSGFVITFLAGMLSGYNKVEMLLDETEEVYMRQGRDNYKRRMEEQHAD